MFFVFFAKNTSTSKLFLFLILKLFFLNLGKVLNFPSQMVETFKLSKGEANSKAFVHRNPYRAIQSASKHKQNIKTC